jgi:uncharacterized membrane protein YkoI
MKYSKQIVTFVMAGSLSITSILASPVFAATTYASATTTSATTTAQSAAKLTQEQAVAVVKAAGLPVPDDAPSNASLNPNGYMTTNPVWELNWMLGNPGVDPNYGNLNATIDAVTGTLLNFNVWKNADNKSTFPPKVEKDKAQQIALALIKKLQPDKSTLVKPIDEPTVTGQGSLRGPFSYNFRFERFVNGIAVPSDGFSIAVDGNGNVTSYSYNWTNIADAQFPSATSVYDLAKATQVYQNALTMQLQYQPFYTMYKADGPEMHLVYQPYMTNNTTPYPYAYMDPSTSGLWIDATNGSLLDNTGKQISADAYQPKPLQIVDVNGQDSPAPTLDKPLTITQALEIAKKYVNVDDSYSLGQGSDTQNGRTTYNFNWNKQDSNGGPGTFYNVTIDAQTGQLVQLYQRPYSVDSSKTTISQDSSQQAAINFIKKVLPNRTKALYLRPQPQIIDPIGAGKQESYYFTFGMLVNGVPNDFNSVTVQIDPVTGNVLTFFTPDPYNNQDHMKYPDPKQALPADKAKTIYQAATPLQLQYVRPVKADHTGLSDSFILVYAPTSTKPGEVLDAISGNWISPFGQSVNDTSSQATDIKGHWAEQSLKVLIDKGILKVVDGKVNPNSTITRGDLLRMLILAIGAPLQTSSNKTASFSDVSASSEYFPYVETAVTYHWIDKGTTFNPSAPVTREELAGLLTRALGYQDLAKYSSLFNVTFKDKDQIDKNYFGDVAIMNGLDIMHGSGNMFKPKQSTTVAEAAVSIIKTVEVINNKTNTGQVYFIKGLQQKVQKMQK